MGTPKRRRDSSGSALSVLGNVLLLLATLAVGGLVAYLVLYPPGVLDPASQQSLLESPPASQDPAASPAPVEGEPAPDPAAAPAGALTLPTACAAVSPLLSQADQVRTTALNNPDALVSEEISALTSELDTLSNLSPPELNSLIDTLNGVLVALNNALLAGEENPDLDSESAMGSTDAIRTLCDG